MLAGTIFFQNENAPGRADIQPYSEERNAMKLESLCLHAGYSPENGQPRVLPIAQSTTFKYDSTAEVAKLFDLAEAGFFYTRLGNPTVDAVERKIAALEGGVGALCTSSGQAASMLAVLNLAQSGEHVVSASSIYGGTFNLFAVTLKKLGIEVTFVDQTASDEELEKAFRPNTRAVFGETLTNPSMDVLDIKRFAKLAHRHRLPLIVDNTFLSPYFQNPLKLGADIVVHSGTKYLGGHNDTLAGFLITNREDIQEQLRFIIKTTGATLAPMDSWLILRGIKTLGVRMDRAQENALKIAHFLEKQEYVTRVLYPGLESHPGYELMKKQARGFGSILTFEVDSKERAYHILENVKLIHFAESLGGTETLITYPITQTHADLSREELDRNGITDRILRLSVGIEGAEDLIADLEAVLK